MQSIRRVVVTGLGTLTPIGNDIQSTWNALLNGESGISTITHFDPSQHRCQIAGIIKNFEAAKYLPLKELRRFDPFVHYGYAAATDALKDAGLTSEVLEKLDRTRIGSIMGSGIGGLGTIENSEDVLRESGVRRVSPFFIPGCIINMTAGLVAINHGLQGPNLATATACTSSAHAIGLAGRLIAYGDADIMIAGGSEHASTPLGIAGFSSMQALSTQNDDPQAASRPFDKDRDGFVLGDGAGALVLESLEHAQARGARIYAELTGFGMSDDANHVTAPPANGEGAALAMRNAIKDSGLKLEDIHYINAHGTSTPLGDIAESRAIRNVFGSHANQLAVSSTKSMTGHLLGAAGVVEAIVTILALQDQIAPPTINLDNPDTECDLDYVAHKARKMIIRNVMSNSFGFGGTNASLIFSQFN